MSNNITSTTMSDNIVTGPQSEQAAERDELSSELVVRYIPLIPLLAVAVVLVNFTIFFGVIMPA
jgi:hypothetical protein